MTKRCKEDRWGRKWSWVTVVEVECDAAVMPSGLCRSRHQLSVSYDISHPSTMTCQVREYDADESVWPLFLVLTLLLPARLVSPHNGTKKIHLASNCCKRSSFAQPAIARFLLPLQPCHSQFHGHQSESIVSCVSTATLSFSMFIAKKNDMRVARHHPGKLRKLQLP